MSFYDADSLLRSPEYQAELAAQRTFMARVYGWMTLGLLATAFTALAIASSPAMIKTIFASGGFWILIIAELAIAFSFQWAIRFVPVPLAAAMFIVYSVLTGATISIILLVYTLSSVAATFFIAAGMFAGVSAYGYLTKRNLDSIGSFLIMGLWGVVIASVVNIFLRSDGMSWLISFIGVIVFTGLAAYDTQKMKQAYAQGESGSAMNRKVALLGAFALYLDFINLFLFLLRFLGSRRD
jgi:uncharacterized protein